MKNGLGRNRVARNRTPRSVSPSTALLFFMFLLLSIASLRELMWKSGRSEDMAAEDLKNGSQHKQFNFAWYMKSGQWRADMRSLAAAIEYLAEPGTVAQTNGPATKTGKV